MTVSFAPHTPTRQEAQELLGLLTLTRTQLTKDVAAAKQELRRLSGEVDRLNRQLSDVEISAEWLTSVAHHPATRNRPIRSSAGQNPWHPALLDGISDIEPDVAYEIADNIDHGRCPRCTRPLPEPPERPVGSRFTDCRSIPICGLCGEDEAFEFVQNGWVSGAWDWPLGNDELDERRQNFLDGGAIAAVLDRTAGEALPEKGVRRFANPCVP